MLSKSDIQIIASTAVKILAFHATCCQSAFCKNVTKKFSKMRVQQNSASFLFQVLDKYTPPDHYLPESYTCFFLLKMPRYSCQLVLCEKLKYAIHFCKSIDSDDYARIDLTGEQAEEYDTDVEAF